MFKEILNRYFFNYHGPTDHIISITNKCNNNCKYCITNSTKNGFSMNAKTVKKVIDFIFTIPQESYYIEFTGGEPFLNTDALEYAIKYAKNKAEKLNKKIHFSIVSNLKELTKKEIKLILKYKITVCSSLDGPSFIHNLTRNNTYHNVLKNLKKLIYYSERRLIETPNIITTITKKSLEYHREIVDEYIKLGIMRVQLGYLEPYGKAIENWNEIGINPDEYFEFYKNAINYIIEINKIRKIPVYEKGLYLLVYDILNNKKPRQRAIDIYHRLAYDAYGNIYPSDEARIIGENGDKVFLLGNVNEGFEKILKKKKTKILMLENFQELTRPLCSRCEYSDYCRVATYFNYITQKSFYGNMITNERCKLFKKIFEFIFQLLKEKETLNILRNWTKIY